MIKREQQLLRPIRGGVGLFFLLFLPILCASTMGFETNVLWGLSPHKIIVLKTPFTSLHVLLYTINRLSAPKKPPNF